MVSYVLLALVLLAVLQPIGAYADFNYNECSDVVEKLISKTCRLKGRICLDPKHRRGKERAFASIYRLALKCCSEGCYHSLMVSYCCTDVRKTHPEYLYESAKQHIDEPAPQYKFETASDEYDER